MISPRKGLLFYLSSCRPCRDGQSCHLAQRDAVDQLSNGILLQTSLNGFSKRKE